jgi:hypothetical protein
MAFLVLNSLMLPSDLVESKEIRFAQLVKTSGKPSTITLWTKPKDNAVLMKAVRENRVLTVFQKPTGTQKDYGQIGFFEQPFSLYLIFPKPLPKPNQARIIGIKYDALEEVGLKAEVTAKKTAKPKPAVVEKQKLLRTKFTVTVTRTAAIKTKLNITAENISDAESLALEQIQTKPIELSLIKNEVTSVSEIS